MCCSYSTSEPEPENSDNKQGNIEIKVMNEGSKIDNSNSNNDKVINYKQN